VAADDGSALRHCHFFSFFLEKLIDTMLSDGFQILNQLILKNVR